MRVIVVLLFAAACGGSAKTPPPAAPCNAGAAPKAAAPVLASQAELDLLADRMCQCKDPACRATVVEDMKRTVTTVERGADVLDTALSCMGALPALKEMRALRGRACTCTDAACATDVQASFDTFLEKHKDTKGSQTQAEEIGQLAGELAECLKAAQQP